MVSVFIPFVVSVSVLGVFLLFGLGCVICDKFEICITCLLCNFRNLHLLLPIIPPQELLNVSTIVSLLVEGLGFVLDMLESIIGLV